MIKRQGKWQGNNPLSLLIVEGYTELVFYSLIRDRYLRNLRVKIANLHGQNNINRQILREIYLFWINHPHEVFRVYCCIDTERGNRYATPLELDIINNGVRVLDIRPLLSIDNILADREIESWFFHDLDGIYDWLKVPQEKRDSRFTNPVNRYGKKDLKKLFRDFNNSYKPGKKAGPFIQSLDFDRVIAKCQSLRDGIAMIKSQAGSTIRKI